MRNIFVTSEVVLSALSSMLIIHLFWNFPDGNNKAYCLSYSHALKVIIIQPTYYNPYSK